MKPLIAVLRDEDWHVCEATAEALGEIGDVRAVEPLIATLKYKDARRAASRALGEIGDTRAVEPFIAILEEISSPQSHFYDICKAAVEALGKIGDPRVVAPLIASLEEKGREVRSLAAKSLVILYSSGSLDDQQKSTEIKGHFFAQGYLEYWKRPYRHLV